MREEGEDGVGGGATINDQLKVDLNKSGYLCAHNRESRAPVIKAKRQLIVHGYISARIDPNPEIMVTPH